MRRIWLLSILLLIAISTASNNPIERDYSLEIIEENKPEEVYYPLYDSGIVIDSSTIVFLDDVKITKQMFNVLDTMIKAALQDSVELIINSGYRTFHEQLACRIHNARKKYKQDTSFLLYAESRKFHPITAKPGYSSHQRGIAFDINTSNDKVFRWLKENAIKFGFVRTVKSEKWHWEYRPEVTDMYQFIKQSHRSWRS